MCITGIVRTVLLAHSLYSDSEKFPSVFSHSSPQVILESNLKTNRLHQNRIRVEQRSARHLHRLRLSSDLPPAARQVRLAPRQAILQLSLAPQQQEPVHQLRRGHAVPRQPPQSCSPSIHPLRRAARGSIPASQSDGRACKGRTGGGEYESAASFDFGPALD